MKKLTIENIINITGGNLLTGNNEEICINFSKDTRTIKNGDIYIGIKGEKFDGNLFWKEALEKGAKGVILQNVKISEEEINKYYTYPIRKRTITTPNKSVHSIIY